MRVIGEVDANWGLSSNSTCSPSSHETRSSEKVNPDPNLLCRRRSHWRDHLCGHRDMLDRNVTLPLVGVSLNIKTLKFVRLAKSGRRQIIRAQWTVRFSATRVLTKTGNHQGLIQRTANLSVSVCRVACFQEMLDLHENHCVEESVGPSEMPYENWEFLWNRQVSHHVSNVGLHGAFLWNPKLAQKRFGDLVTNNRPTRRDTSSVSATSGSDFSSNISSCEVGANLRPRPVWDDTFSSRFVLWTNPVKSPWVTRRSCRQIRMNCGGYKFFNNASLRNNLRSQAIGPDRDGETVESGRFRSVADF